MNTNHKSFQEFGQSLNLLGRVDASVAYLTESLKKKATLDDKKENARYIPMTPGGLGVHEHFEYRYDETVRLDAVVGTESIPKVGKVTVFYYPKTNEIRPAINYLINIEVFKRNYVLDELDYLWKQRGSFFESDNWNPRNKREMLDYLGIAQWVLDLIEVEIGS